ncbi:MAG: molecular chaperone DnaJ [Myxococcota bacterium]|jgi:molecular chaperone DnaJ|nr:molecular chaperone DnaJ [Myxococcota bacterium]
MEPRRDYYEVLEIPRSASPEEIKRAYRRLAMRYHPDRAQGEPGAEDRFKEASEAYAVLSDPQRRLDYDRFGRVRGFEPGTNPFDNASIQEIFAEIFSDLFGRKKPAKKRGRDLRYDLRISLEEVVRGAEKPVRVPRKIRCATCQGSGSRPGSEPRVCGTCQGTGEIKVQQGIFSLKRPCSGCHGEGRIVTDPCRTCFGTGLAEVEQVLTVKIPPGVADGQRLRVAGKGEDGAQGGDPGDLFVHLTLLPHPFFTREGNQLRCRVVLSASEAALGCQLSLPTLQGRERLRIPPGTQPGTLLRLAGRGLPALDGKSRGDQLVAVEVETPERLQPRQRELYEELQRLEADTLPRRVAFRNLLGELERRA